MEVMLLPEPMSEPYQAYRTEHGYSRGDIGEVDDEIGFLFGQYKRLRNEFTGVLTRQRDSHGVEVPFVIATGYGCDNISQKKMLNQKNNLKASTSHQWFRQRGAAPLKKMPGSGAKAVNCQRQFRLYHDKNGFDREKLCIPDGS